MNDKIFGVAGELCVQSQRDGVQDTGFAAAGGTEDAEQAGGGQRLKIDGLLLPVAVDSPQSKL